MDRRLKAVFGLACALAWGLCLSPVAFGQALPEGKGKAEFVHNCTACHRADLVTAAKKTAAEWKINVRDMAARGTDGSQEDLDNVALYMATYYATDKPNSVEAPSKPPVTASTGTEHAKNLLLDNGCLACHRVEQQGSYSGPSLNGVGARRTTDEIRAALVHPRPTLDPGNRLMQLTTADGRTIVGRMVSQDDHDVRLIDASGKTATYARSAVRQSTMIDTNPMPSYEKRLTGDDLDALVRYLASLPALEESGPK